MEDKDFIFQNQTQNNNFNPFKFLVVVVICSFVFGSLGGFVGNRYFSKIPSLKKYYNNNLASQSPLRQQITLTENSPIIEVVKKTNPAVVSIAISKDVSKSRNFGFDPFEDDFFSPFFSFPAQPKQTAPNIQQVGAGSGFFVSKDGLILTNRHVVEDESAKYTVITADKKKYEAKVLALDPRNDLAIVKIDITNAPFLQLADSKDLQIGQTVVAIGNSLGQYQNAVTSGIVSGIGRSIVAADSHGSESLDGVIQTDAAINPGNSGGPLLNLAGQVVGVNTAIDRQGQLVGFAIPASDAQKALNSYIKSGKISRPFIGVRYMMLSKELALQQKLPKDYGALLIRGQNITDFAVIPGSPADKAGLVENDIILEVDGVKLDIERTLASVLKNRSVGEEVSLKIYHKGQEKTVKLILAESK